MTARLLVLAKTPVPGKVKTRLCPPCTPEQAARTAAAALADTLGTVSGSCATDRVLVIDGDLAAPAGWTRLPQQGDLLGDRLAHAYAAVSDAPALLIGMDTPQVTAGLLTAAIGALDEADAVLGLAEDGGWWALGLREPAHARVLREVPMSTAETGALTLAALQGLGLRVSLLPTLRDVDTATDARAVAALCHAGSRFRRAVAQFVPADLVPAVVAA